ncbi:MAG: hypothetical protein IIC06_08205 [Proteobacteria bacterium]|nr:hypothetical protein [Pseudomonadota bacterium]
MNMLRPLFICTVLSWAALTAGAQAEETNLLSTQGVWEAYQESEGGKKVCYLGSLPKKATGKYKKRGETYVLITHRPAEKSANVVSVKAGYTYQENSEVEVIIGTETFKLFTDAGHAFAYDQKTDGRLVKAMIRGAKMVIKGTSSRGTKTTDSYSLKGFTAAYQAINKACKIK